MKAANWEWDHPMRKKCVAVNTTERSSEDILTSDVEMQIGVCLADFGLLLYFHTFFPLFWNGNEYPVLLYVI